MAFLEASAGQGHAYAMDALGRLHSHRKEFAQALRWATKVGRCRLTPS
jgi:hypothetical protein